MRPRFERDADGVERPLRPRQAPARRLPMGHVAKREMGMALPREPWLPAPYDDVDILAFQACKSGRASPQQQVRMLEWLIFAAGTYVTTHVPGAADDTAFANGRRHLGLAIINLLNAKPTGDTNG